MAFDYCNGSLPEHELVACGNFKKSGFDALAFVEQDHTITDWTDTSQWQTNIADGKVKLVQQVKGDLPAPTKLESENPVGGGVESIADGMDWTFTVQDSNTNTNNDGFWEQMNKRQVYVVMHNPRESEIYVVLQDSTVYAAPVIAGGSGREYQRYDIEIKWESNVDEFFDRYAAPAGIFS